MMEDKKALCVGGPLSGRWRDPDSETFHTYEQVETIPDSYGDMCKLKAKIYVRPVVYVGDIIQCNKKKWYFYRPDTMTTEQMIDMLCNNFKVD